MKNMTDVIFKSNIVLLFLLTLTCSSCSTDNSTNVTVSDFPYYADTFAYLDTFPSNIYLELGKSVFIENGMSIFSFISVLESNENNSSIRMQVEYEDGFTQTVNLNTKNTPQTYQLRNGYNFGIHLKELNFVENTYQIMFTYNQYFNAASIH